MATDKRTAANTGDFESSFPESTMEAKEFTSAEGQKIVYRIYRPKDAHESAPLPVVMFLHGAGERGDNNTSQLVHCAPQLMRYVIDGNHPAIVLIPQCPSGMQWVNTPWSDTSHAMSPRPSKPLQAVIEMLEMEMASAPVDPSRIYISGISMGGYGTWDMLQRFPSKFAAAMPICGGGDISMGPRLVDIPILAVHGSEDDVVPPTRTSSMCRSIERAGGRKVRHVVLQGVDHNSWTPTFNNTSNLDWLFSNAKTAST